MPGVIMDNWGRNGSHTNHDRDPQLNGINGASFGAERVQTKDQEQVEPIQNMTPISPVIANGLNGRLADEAKQHPVSGEDVSRGNLVHQIGELPPEIIHITEGYLPLSRMITRRAEMAHVDLSNQISSMAQMPLPISTANGNVTHGATTSDDNSVENLNKKLSLLKFAKETHDDWLKVLVITQWSRNSEDMSKLIDLKAHFDRHRSYYDLAIHEMMLAKRSLANARVPNPDLKTALEVLSTGKAPWMPELGYIEPPTLTAKDLLKTLENLNTLLSIRLNLHEYDKIPLQFRDYTIKSGRVTFRVAGEFEIDLTIADEDPDSQFWFIDFRFLFSPYLSDLAPHLRFYIESKVNAALLKDGLPGCYRFLHELVLTHKISEFRRQAVALARGLWIGGVKVEPLNRALCIQYWLERYGRDGPESWIILGVHSGRRKDGRSDPKATSRLFLRWFRDGKEVRDAEIPFDDVDISAESLLKTVIAKHVNHILTSMHEKIRAKPLFANHEMTISLSTSPTEPKQSELKVQLTSREQLSINIEPITGRFIFGPASRLIWDYERMLNTRSKDPASDGNTFVENLRCSTIMEEIASRGISAGWVRQRPPALKQDDLKSVIPRDTLQIIWFRRPGWSKDWFVAVTLSMGGERWWLIEFTNDPTGGVKIGKTNTTTGGVKIASAFEIPIKEVSPVPTYSFLSRLHIFASAMLSDYTNLRALHSRRAFTTLRPNIPTSPIRLPAIFLRLSELLPSKNKSPRTGLPWAKDILKLTYQGLEVLPPRVNIPAVLPSPKSQSQVADTPAIGRPANAAVEGLKSTALEERAIMVTEARMVVPVPAALTALKEKVDRDIAFHTESGAFAFRLRSRVGESIIPSLIERLVRVERLVDFVEVVRKHEKALRCEAISLGKIIFTYGIASIAHPDAMDIDGSAKSYKAVVDFSAADNMMMLTLQSRNPHIRVLDTLTKILNSKQGLDGVATLLPLTLPALSGLDSIEREWQSLFAIGEVLVFVRAVDWYCIRYNLTMPASTTTSPASKDHQRIMIDIRLRQRKGVSWWHIRRTDERNQEGDDDMDEQLKSVWNAFGDGWKGMRLSAVAQPAGVEECLGKIDEVIRTAAADQKSSQTVTAPVVQVQPQSPAQVQPQARPQQQKPIATPNHTQSQSQSQGRNNAKPSREIVEID